MGYRTVCTLRWALTISIFICLIGKAKSVFATDAKRPRMKIRTDILAKHHRERLGSHSRIENNRGDDDNNKVGIVNFDPRTRIRQNGLELHAHNTAVKTIPSAELSAKPSVSYKYGNANAIRDDNRLEKYNFHPNFKLLGSLTVLKIAQRIREVNLEKESMSLKHPSLNVSNFMLLPSRSSLVVPLTVSRLEQQIPTQRLSHTDELIQLGESQNGSSLNSSVNARPSSRFLSSMRTQSLRDLHDSELRLSYPSTSSTSTSSSSSPSSSSSSSSAVGAPPTLPFTLPLTSSQVLQKPTVLKQSELRTAHSMFFPSQLPGSIQPKDLRKQMNTEYPRLLKQLTFIGKPAIPFRGRQASEMYINIDKDSKAFESSISPFHSHMTILSDTLRSYQKHEYKVMKGKGESTKSKSMKKRSTGNTPNSNQTSNSDFGAHRNPPSVTTDARVPSIASPRILYHDDGSSLKDITNKTTNNHSSTYSKTHNIKNNKKSALSTKNLNQVQAKNNTTNIGVTNFGDFTSYVTERERLNSDRRQTQQTTRDYFTNTDATTAATFTTGRQPKYKPGSFYGPMDTFENIFPRKTLHIGGFFELSGAYPGNGQSDLDAALLAIEHVNDQHIIPGYRLELLFNDSKCWRLYVSLSQPSSLPLANLIAFLLESVYRSHFLSRLRLAVLF
ncbi:gamma-aminobutyric acid type B receptor subunit 1 [Elysia marginata]|uniref:Gamma-aminobutyric acid type B receptor subunit 1 n=1 Tax=Elysia marginata TaxID=1093978 RepID=A0AAV4ILJ8_9GAST|nr:gamma-aminobutyric acid type B receptor subunit 1 [Elysia marginata]